jgi:hypothetical protein
MIVINNVSNILGFVIARLFVHANTTERNRTVAFARDREYPRKWLLLDRGQELRQLAVDM